MNCSRCGAAVAEGAAFCPSCGTEQSTGSAPSAGVGSTGTSKGAVALTFDIKRWSQTDRIVGVATLVLFISLFFPWYGVSATGVSITADGLWHGYEYITLIVCILMLVYLLARALWPPLSERAPAGHEQMLTAAALVNLILVIIGFVLKPTGTGVAVGWRFGAFLALIAAIIAFAPKLVPAAQARLAKRRS